MLAFTTSIAVCPITSYVASGAGITHTASGTGITATDRKITISTTVSGVFTAIYIITAEGGATVSKTVTLTVICPATVIIYAPSPL